MKKFYILLLAFIFSATILSAQTINEGFEGTFPPTGWTKQSPDLGTGWATTTTGTSPVPGFTGGTVTACTDGLTSMAYCSYETGGAAPNPTICNQWLITPKINNVAANYTVNFWMRKFGGYKDNIKVLVSSTNNAVADFTITLATVNFLAADSGWINYNYALTAQAGQNIYVAFNEYVSDNNADGAFISIDNVQVGPSSSINELSTKIYTNVYPSPTKNSVTVESSTEINKVKVVNMVGQVVLERNINSKISKINISDLESGVYFMQMEYAEGSITKRFIVE